MSGYSIIYVIFDEKNYPDINDIFSDPAMGMQAETGTGSG